MMHSATRSVILGRHSRGWLCGWLMLGLAGCAPSAHQVPPAQRLEQGWTAYRLGDYKLAVATFAAAEKDAIADENIRLQARYGQAVTWDTRQPVSSQQDDLARELYQQIMAENPAHDMAAWSSLALARMSHLVPVGEEPDYPKVREAYQQVIERYPRHLAGQEALIYQQATLIQSLDPEQTGRAIARLQQFLQEQPDARFASAAYNLLAQGYETLGRHDEQLEARQREIATLEVDPSSPAASDFSWRYWQLATTAEFLAGRFDVARVYYQKLIDEYPQDFRKFGARQALQRMTRVEQQLRAEVTP